MIKVLLVDDHELVRHGIKSLLEEVRGIKVVGDVDSGEEAIKFCRQEEPDIVLMDMNMPGIGGLEATKKILRFSPDSKIIVLTVHCESPFPSKFMQIGALGYLSKKAGQEEMIKAIRQVQSGQRYISPEIAQQVALATFAGKHEENPFDQLSERELQIMMMITEGEKVQDIAEKLNLSPKTVNSYRYRMFEKLNIDSDVALTRLAYRHGVIDLDKL